ncbi:MAG: MOSC domain-containing protein [Gaiellales bacterium]
MRAGVVEGIYLRPSPEDEPAVVGVARAVAGRGLVGDRYHRGNGTFSREGKKGQDLTLIEAEALDGLAADTGIRLRPQESRRNILTRGVSLEQLLGQRFRVGDAECLGVRRCPPCSRLEALTREGVRDGLVRRGGLRADVLSGGRIALGDSITRVESQG